MIRIDGNPLGAQSGQSRDLASHERSQTGTWRGERATVKDAASSLADAAEEISLHNSEKVESKRFGERKCEGEKTTQIQAIEDIRAYLDACQAYDDPQKLAHLAKRMLEHGSDPRGLARRESQDPSQQFMLLQYALHEGEQGGADFDALEHLRDALADLEMEAGPQIRAGLNTIAVAAEFAVDGQGVSSFQSTYQDVVLGENSLSQTLQLLLQRLGGPEGDDLGRGMQSMIKALGHDLSAARPSTDSNRLQALVQDLYQLEVAATVLDGCRELGDRLAEKYAVARFGAAQLMTDLVAITGEKWVASSRFANLADRQGVHGIEPQIVFHKAVKDLLREMPPRVFSDGDVRQSVLDAAQQALDEAIEREEDEA